MNDASQIDLQVLNRDAALNTLMYLDEYFRDEYDVGVNNGTSVNDIVTLSRTRFNFLINASLATGKTKEEIRKEYGDDLRKISILENSIKNDPGLGELVIANQSIYKTDPKTGLSYEKGGLSACTFQDKSDNPSYVIFVYRGTGPAEWLDNGVGLSGQVGGTSQQNQATNYFNDVIQRNGWNYSKPAIHITGHSKGANKAQYVVMTSFYSDLIVNGYSLDGQCLSPEEIEYMKKTLGEDEYEKRRNKLYSISADNDYVNVLGVNDKYGRLIPKDHVFYLKSNLSGIAWHYPDCYLNEDGTLTDFIEQGAYSKIIQGISEAIMDLPVPIRSVITNGSMALFQMLYAKDNPIDGESISYADVIACVPFVFAMLPSGTIEYLGNQFGVNLEWLSNVVAATTLLMTAPLILGGYAIGYFIDQIIIAIDKIKEFGKKCQELTTKVVEFIEKGINKVEEWFKNAFNSGYRYANSHPQITLDTYKLQSYAKRLADVNRRVGGLDKQMDNLYWKVGLLDLWNLMQADLLTNYNWRIVRCVGYLNDTASDFDSVESNLINNL